MTDECAVKEMLAIKTPRLGNQSRVGVERRLSDAVPSRS